MNFVYFMHHFLINKHPKFDQLYGPLRSNDRFVWIKTNFSILINRNAIVLDGKALANDSLTLDNHQKGRGFFIHVALVLARPFQPETILFRWMKIETTQLLFVQPLNQC